MTHKTAASSNARRPAGRSMREGFRADSSDKRPVRRPRATALTRTLALVLPLALALALPAAAPAVAGEQKVIAVDGAVGAGLGDSVAIEGDATVNLGGLLPLPGGPSCTLCATFVTTFDVDGSSGPVGSTTRMHRNLVANVPYTLDVDGNLPPLPIGILPLPGYELRATVEALDAKRPTVRLARLGSVPAQLPLRVEIVTGDLTSDSAPKTTFGYDTLDATAPKSFVAALDLSDRDADANTVNAFADLTINTTARRLTVLSEGFTGAPDGERSERHIRRLTYRGDPAKGTSVPERTSLAVSSSPASQRTVLTRDLRTTLDVEVIEAVDGRRMTGTLDELPARVDLTIDDADVNSDGDLDTRATYLASGVVQNATLRMDEGDTSSRATVTRLPSDVKLTYATLDNDTDKTSDDGTAVTYRSNGRATHAELRREDGPRVMTASMDGVPANITDLRYVPSVHGAHVVYTSDARATGGTVEVTDASTAPNVKRTKATLVNVPASMDLTWSSPVGGGFAHYFSPAGHVADQAKLELDDEKGQKTTIDLVEFPATVNVDYVKSDRKLDFDYSASSEVPSAEIHGTNFDGLPDAAKDLHLSLKRVPTGVGLLVEKSFSSQSETNELPPPEECSHVDDEDAAELPNCPQHPDYTPLTETITRTTSDNDLSVTTPGGRLGSGEIQLTSGPDERMPATAEKGNELDGVRIHDSVDHFVAFARVSEFDQLLLKRHNEGSRRTGPGISPPPHSASTLDATLDSQAEDHALGIEIINEGKNSSGQPTLSRTSAQLVTLPSRVQLHQSANSTFGENKTIWSASRAVDGWLTSEIDGARRPGFVITKSSKVGTNPEVITEQAKMDPMPANFSICQIARLNRCSEERFDENLARLRDGDGPYRTRACSPPCTTDPQFPIEVDHAGNGSFLLKADTATDFSYRSGDWFEQKDPFTTVNLQDLVTFGLQGHKENYPCSFGSLTNDCKKGHVAMDTRGHELIGRIEQRGENSVTRLDFPEGFSANRLVWAFNKTGATTGYVATIGDLDCADNTQVTLGNETINERFCDGDLLDGTILDQL